MEQDSKSQRNKNIKTALVLWIIVALIIITFFIKNWG